MIPRIAIVGIHGYGASHVVNALRLEASGVASLVGLVDPVGGAVTRGDLRIEQDALPPTFPDLEALVRDRPADIIIISTPLHTHAALAKLAVQSGADVLLEKPPVTNLADFAELVAEKDRHGRSIQVGFQSLGSHAIPALRALIARGRLGEVQAIGAVGSWTRDAAYWTRSAWAGRRTMNGIDVVDGVVTNPLAHAVMTALALAGWSSPDAIETVETELFHANPIEADDTSTVRITPSPLGEQTFAGAVTCAFTLAARREDRPHVMVRGSAATARLFYADDRLTIDETWPTGGGTGSGSGSGSEYRNASVHGDASVHHNASVHDNASVYGRDDLLENLIAHRSSGTPLIAPLENTGGFVRVMEAIRDSTVHEIAQGAVTWVGEGTGRRPVVTGIDALVMRAASEGRLFSELDVPWVR